MADVPLYKGSKGQSGMTPAGVNTKKGAYGVSARSMGDAMTPNRQHWNSYGEDPKRNGAIKNSNDPTGSYGKTTY